MRLFVRLLLITLTLALVEPCHAKKDPVSGPEGRIAYTITLPKGFNTATDHCPMVILMHGIFSSKGFIPMPQIAQGLARAGIGSIRFDFDGHGKSDGRKQDIRCTSRVGLCANPAICKPGWAVRPFPGRGGSLHGCRSAGHKRHTPCRAGTPRARFGHQRCLSKRQVLQRAF